MLANSAPSERRPLVTFFVLVFLFTTPFWMIGAISDVQILPGLPVAGLAVVCPAAAALILTLRRSGMRGAVSFLARVLDFSRASSPLWFSAAVLIPPAISVLAYLSLRWLGTPVPAPELSLASIFMLVVIFFPAAAAEELGWSGYATEPLQARFGEIGASLILGTVWSAWHLPALVQAHRSVDWIAWWCLGTAAARTITVWLFNRTGRSVFAATVYHALSNVSWQLFPIDGSYFDPRINGVITAAVAGVLIASAKMRGRPGASEVKRLRRG